ncbi:hypothetical protein [Streptomyces sp. NBC_00344]|uniref:hypothetical protein n=1 Tax=Streptomyces sp. NBC_00344 TaxID=2975720 RepID=UPI002E1B11D2
MEYTLSTSRLAGVPPVRLPGTPWSVRMARASGGRAALELYAGDDVLDVLVATSLDTRLLRGACVGVTDSGRQVLAWGVLEPGRAAAPRVVFTPKGWWVRSRETQAAVIGGSFWLCVSQGRFSRVAVTRCDGGVERWSV